MNRGHLSSFNYFCHLRYFLLFLVCNGLAPAEIVLHIFRSFLNRCCLKNKIVICGSSIVARWHMLSWDMSPLPVVNCAISGSTTFNLSSIGLSPAAIVVIYVGSNDLKSGGNPKAIAGRLESFVDQLDNQKVVLVSSIKSPDRQNYWDKVEEYNRLQQEIVNKDPTKRVYVDVTSVLQEHLESFTCDGLHLTYSGFALFRDILKPVLQAEYDKLNQQQIEGDIESRMP